MLIYRKTIFFPTETENQPHKDISSGLKSYNRDRALPGSVRFHLVSKIKGKFDQHLTKEELEKYQSDTLVMEDADCISQMFEELNIFKREPDWKNVKCKQVIT